MFTTEVYEDIENEMVSLELIELLNLSECTYGLS